MVKITLEKDAEGFAYTCPLCHHMYFSTGDQDLCKNVVQDHLQQYHRIVLPAAVITEDDTEAPKVRINPVVS